MKVLKIHLCKHFQCWNVNALLFPWKNLRSLNFYRLCNVLWVMEGLLTNNCNFFHFFLNKLGSFFFLSSFSQNSYQQIWLLNSSVVKKEVGVLKNMFHGTASLDMKHSVSVSIIQSQPFPWDIWKSSWLQTYSHCSGHCIRDPVWWHPVQFGWCFFSELALNTGEDFGYFATYSSHVSY